VSILSVTPEHAHPSWCDLSYCTHPEVLAQRGQTDADVSPWRHHTHWSTPRTIGADRRDDVVFTFSVGRDTDQPVAEVPDVLDVQLTWTDKHQIIGVYVTPAQVPLLAEAFTEYRDLWTTSAGFTPADIEAGNPVLFAVAHALRVLGAVTRENAAALLGLTVVELTDRERAEVLAAFPVRGVQ
jgi:hypothetical protein